MPSLRICGNAIGRRGVDGSSPLRLALAGRSPGAGAVSIRRKPLPCFGHGEAVLLLDNFEGGRIPGQQGWNHAGGIDDAGELHHPGFCFQQLALVRVQPQGDALIP